MSPIAYTFQLSISFKQKAAVDWYVNNKKLKYFNPPTYPPNRT